MRPALSTVSTLAGCSRRSTPGSAEKASASRPAIVSRPARLCEPLLTAAQPRTWSSIGSAAARSIVSRSGFDNSPIAGAPSQAGAAAPPRPLKVVGEFAQQAPVKVALERHDRVGKRGRLDPLPVAKLGVAGGDVDVAVAPEEARQIPVLVLADPGLLPDHTDQFVGQAIFQPLGALGDTLDQARTNAGFLFQLAQSRGPW